MLYTKGLELCKKGEFFENKGRWKASLQYYITGITELLRAFKNDTNVSRECMRETINVYLNKAETVKILTYMPEISVKKTLTTIKETEEEFDSINLNNEYA